MEMEFTKNGQETVYYKIFDFFLLVFEVSTETIFESVSVIDNKWYAFAIIKLLKSRTIKVKTSL